MKLQEMIAIEGTKGYSVLCYGLFKTDYNSQYVNALLQQQKSLKTSIYKLWEDGWNYYVILVEMNFKQFDDLHNVINEAVGLLMHDEGCLVSACMVDGIFADVEDLFSEINSNEIYAYCFQDGSRVVNFDDESRPLEKWKNIIRNQKAKIGF